MRFGSYFNGIINRALNIARADIVPECGHLSSILRHKAAWLRITLTQIFLFNILPS
ncbi:hypothetical protein KCP73_26395 [Salmonella enterica subsp. enterica]|nr:hypothetical protein KCP73_26395 [Salmonella enterica subsp. enterica]